MSVLSRSLTVFAALGLAACASSGGQMAEPAPAPAAAPAAPAPAPAAAPAGGGAVYSQVQANRGRDQFRSTCTECHTQTEFSDQAFKVKWSRRTVGDLFEFIHTSMPDDAPGILSENQAIDLVSWILSMNGFEAGSSQLQPDMAELEQISLASIRS